MAAINIRRQAGGGEGTPEIFEPGGRGAFQAFQTLVTAPGPAHAVMVDGSTNIIFIPYTFYANVTLYLNCQGHVA